VARGRHDVVIKCINGKAALPLTYVAARLTRRRFVLWTGVWQHPRGLAHRIGRPLVRYIYRHADAVLTYGRHVSRHVAEQGVDPARIVVAAQAVDLTRFSIDGTSAPGPAGGQVLFVGRLEAAKGPQLLVEAWPAVVAAGIDARCTLVGEGPLRDALAARIAELGLTDQIRLAGSVPNADLPSVYRGADVTVIPSILTDDFAEPWSLAVNEAMGCGSLVIASTAVGAVRDGLVAGGCTGLTFPWGDVDALAHALIAALGDPRRRRELAAAGHAAVQSYSYAAAADGFARAVAIARAG
jgi:glycosyltransferase involved in cell wall biosynthesis